MRLGLFGGTFDPPHLGHLVLAEWARDRLGLDRVLFVPAGTPPHKRERRLSAAAHRVAMTRLAVRGHPAFTVSTIETRRAGTSFTVDTLRALRRSHPDARLYLLIGEDSLDEFHAWHAPEAILQLATLAVARRACATARAPRERRRVVRIGNPVIDVSSSLARRRARAGRSIRYLVPDAVAAYIARHRLYRGRA
ncbi:MAG: nicotinate (nicotinamide) nucleotide adenylyltransferase [Candidatus Eisenbacteria bacterium RBG_16_71_46]|nr:MAG: nicotinate (nicotinamide) nucleotide adenylyltransferase [Candidatus Eisenbacteria bacterium RBG_16_71_46]